MLESGIGYITMFFVVFGICLFFVIVWISRSERARNLLKDKVENLSLQLKSAERERSALLEELEDSQNSAGESEESDVLVQLLREGPEDTEEFVNKMAAGLKNLEEENEILKAELSEVRGSLEEVYKAVHEEELVG